MNFQHPPRLFSKATLLLTVALSIASRSADWTGWRGPGALGVSPSSAVPVKWSFETGTLWKTELPGAGGSSPIVWGDQIYVTAYTGYGVPDQPPGEMKDLYRHLLCVNRLDGRVIWSNKVTAVLPEQEKVRDHGYASSTPVADHDRVYAFFGKSGVFAFSHTGEQLWRADVGDGTHGWGSASSLVLHKDLLIVNASVESGALIALDRATGREVWRTPGMKESWNTPLLVPVDGGRTELVVAIFGKVLGLNPDSGESLWSCDTGIGWYMVPSLVNQGDMVYCIGGRTGGGLAVKAGGRGDVTQSHRAWTMKKGSNVSSPILHEGHLYWVHEQLGVVNCARADTGELVYEERLSRAGQVYASPILAGGNLYVLSRSGTVFVIAAQPEFELLATNPLGDRSRFDASPILEGDRLLIRSDRYLHCVGLKP